MKRHKPTPVWLQRIENLVAEGMPDVHVSGPESECWVELKYALRPKRESTRFLGSRGLRPGQINWHLKAATKAIVTYVLIKDNHGAFYLVPGSLARYLNDMPREEILHETIASDWPEIFTELMNPKKGK